jgi:hypothetical protein
MAQYAMLIFAKTGIDDGDISPEAMDEHTRHAEELERSGAMVAAVALEPSATATSIRGDAITDGPFIDAKEVIAGFAVLEAPDLDAAIEMARRNPATWQGGGVELRPVASSSLHSPHGPG